MMYSVSYRQMMSHDASAYQAEASSSCAYHTTDTAAMHLDAIIVASIIICALVCLAGAALCLNNIALQRLVLLVAVVVLLVLVHALMPEMRKRV